MMEDINDDVQLRAVIYARVSTDKQTETSIEQQIRMCTNECKRKGYTVTAIYKDVGSGKDATKRPEFQKMLSDMSEWDIVVTYALNRLYRNVLATIQWVDQLRNAGKNFLTLDLGGIDTNTVAGDMVLKFSAVMAETQRLENSKRTSDGMKGRKNAGLHTGRPPYGYSSKKKRTLRKEDGGILEIVPEEADVVKLIFQCRDAGMNNKEIAERLTENGVPTRKGNEWNYSTVRDILKNQSLYQGLYVTEDGEEKEYSWEALL